MMTSAPKFVSSALGFNLTSTGTLSSLPYLARMTFSLIFGAIGDRLVCNSILELTIYVTISNKLSAYITSAVY